MKHLLKIVAYFLLVFFIVSCSNPESKLSKYGNTLEAIIKTDEGIFRGLHFGISDDSLKLKEQEGLIEASDDYFYYELKLDASSSYSIAYSFEEKKLNEIQVDVILTTEEHAAEAYTNFKNYFTEKYGAGENDNGFLLWTTPSDINSTIKIALADESSDYNYGKLTLSFYNAEY